MLADQVRMRAYKEAIASTVKSGDVVCDIGTGSGILAFFSVLSGAKKVYAIEKSGIIEEAQKIAQDNGFSDKIVFIQGVSDKVDLPERVDVITSELIGFFGLEERLPVFKVDARKRFLKPGGKLIPFALELYLAPVESNDIWQDKFGCWRKDFYGVDLSSVKELALSQRFTLDCSGKLKFLAKPEMILRHDFYEDSSNKLVFNGEFAVTQSGVLHGFTGFFKALLSDGVCFSTAPDKPRTHWQQVFFPLQETFKTEIGDSIGYKIKGIPDKGSLFWQWEAKVVRNGEDLAHFVGSNFNLTEDELIFGKKGFRPVLKEDSLVLLKVLGSCDSIKTIEEISDFIIKEFPGRYKSKHDAQQEVVGIIRSMAKRA
jgi:protein arginine N-methyltransferase 1